MSDLRVDNGQIVVCATRLIQKCLARAITAILAANTNVAGPPEVQLQLDYQPGDGHGVAQALNIKVSDEGLGLPEASLHRVLAPLQPLLATGCTISNSMTLQTTTLEEPIVRQYQVTAIAQQPTTTTPQTITTATAPPRPPLLIHLKQTIAKPPGLHLLGTQISLSFDTHRIPVHKLVSAAEQALGMLKMLCPPVALSFKLTDIPLQEEGGGGGQVRVVSESGRYDVLQQLLPIEAITDTVARVRLGLQSEFTSLLPPPTPKPTPLDTTTTTILQQQQQQQTAVVVEPLPPPQHKSLDGKSSVYIGVGHTGHGAPEGAVCPNGCKWSAVAGIVLHVPQYQQEEEEEQQENNDAVAVVGDNTSGGGTSSMMMMTTNSSSSSMVVEEGSEEVFVGGSQRASQILFDTTMAVTTDTATQQQPPPHSQQQQPPSPVVVVVVEQQGISTVSVCTFANYELQHTVRPQVLKALQKCNWGEYGFSIVQKSKNNQQQQQQENNDDGSIEIVLKCSQPESGAELIAAVVHLQSNDLVKEVVKGKVVPLAATYEMRIVKSALEAALEDLKYQCPSVIASRRDRSAMRAVPSVAFSVARIIAKSSTSGFAAEACKGLGCESVEELEEALENALYDAVYNK